jgi:hypothetical protein
MSINIISIVCPKCGAGVNYYEKDRVIHCSHCGKNFIALHSDGIERYYYQPQIRKPEKKVVQFLTDKGYGRSEYIILDEDRFFIPVWKGSGQLTGWISGLSPRKLVTKEEWVSTGDGRRVAVRRKKMEGGIPLKKLMKLEKETLLKGANFPDIRWRKEEITNKNYVNFQRIYNSESMKKWGKIITPDTSPGPQKKKIMSKFIASTLSLYADYKPLYHRLKVIGQRTFLYYFPVALYKIKISDRIVFLTVNGMDGKVTSDTILEKKAEPKFKRKLSLDMLLIFIASFLSTSLFHATSHLLKQLGIIIPIILLIYIWIKK